MWTKSGLGIPIDASQVVVGLFVFMDVRWDEPPFLSNRLLVKTPKDVAIIQSLDTKGRLYYYPEKSTVPLLEYVSPPPISEELQAAATAEKAAIEAERKALDKAKKDKRQKQKDAAARADRAWENAARDTKEALLTLNRAPKADGELLDNLSRGKAATITNGQEILLHLLGDKKDQGTHFHASKVQMPAPILKNANRKKHEEDFFRQHVMFSVDIRAQSGAFSREALSIIADHHETVDGSDWPRARTEMSRDARLLAAVNHYDNMCTPEAEGVDALMPAEALATMFRHEAIRFDKTVLTVLIKLLGVYPPVTLPPDVRAWLNPQQRLSYFFSVENRKG